MRKTLLIGLGIAITLAVGFFIGRWSALTVTSLPAGEDLKGPRAVEDPQPEMTRARVAYLIEMLASRNPAPKITGELSDKDLFIHFPNGYELSLQVSVYLAAEQLLAEGERAFDQLIGHPDDKRYSMTSQSADLRNYNHSVSDVCNQIVRRNVLCFEPELEFLTKGGPHNSDLYVRLGEWWQKNKHRGLVALQLEAIDETIAFTRDVDYRAATGRHPDAPPLPPDDFNRVREENLRTLKAIRQYILQSGEAYQPRRQHRSPDRIVLPWRPAFRGDK